MDAVQKLKYGDIVVLYRTAENSKNAEYSSVATSICVVENIKDQSEFLNFNEFYNYACKYSVFDKNDLYYWFRKGKCKAIKMTYNSALVKRIVRHDLIENIGLQRNQYWGFFELTNKQFATIAEKGGISNLLIN